MERILTRDIPGHIGERVEVAGWVHARRDHGKLVFIDLRDHAGLLQVVFGANVAEAGELRAEWVIRVTGTVTSRPDAMVNPDLPTGSVELKAETLTVLNPSETPPFEVDNDGYHLNEETRLAYRYVDLRRERLQKNLRLRSRLIQEARLFLFSREFTEIETPYLTQTTPEGSRDFIVPSRLQSFLRFHSRPSNTSNY
jgi:aspartyl-tRNA synthetase